MLGKQVRRRRTCFPNIGVFCLLKHSTPVCKLLQYREVGARPHFPVLKQLAYRLICSGAPLGIMPF